MDTNVYSNREAIDLFPATLTTTGNTATPIWQATVNPLSALVVTVSLIGSDGAGVKAGAYGRKAMFYRAAGSAAQQASTVVIGTDIETDSNLDCTITLSGNVVSVNCVGLAATTIRWRARIEVMVL